MILILPFLTLRITVKFNFHSYQGLQLIDPITFLIIHHHSAILYSFLIQSCSVTCHYNYSLSYALLLLPIRLAKPSKVPFSFGIVTGHFCNDVLTSCLNFYMMALSRAQLLTHHFMMRVKNTFVCLFVFNLLR